MEANHLRLWPLFHLKIRLFLIVAFVLSGVLSWSQTPFLSFGTTVLGVGTTSGIQPNYRSGEGSNFIYTSLQQDILIKGVPFQLVGRWSNEPYISGRASYFRFSYQGKQFQKQQIDSLSIKLKALEAQKKGKLDELYTLEGKLGYLNYVLLEQPELDTLTKPTFTLPDSMLLKLPEGSLPNMEGLSPLQQSIALANAAVQLKQMEISGIDSTMFKLNTDYTALGQKKFSRFFDGISRFDVGLSSLPAAHLSNNAIPIQGIRLRGEYKKWHYTFSAGLTVPNQLFSNQALDQVLNNTANLFNLSNFYQVNTTRFASATILEYGEADKNSVFIEEFYTGPSFEGFKPVSSVGSSNAVNFGGNYTPKFAENLTLSGTVGYSVNIADTVETSASDRVSYTTGLKYRLPKIKGEFAAKYRNIGAAYNGFSQGIYISGVRHAESSYRQGIGNRLVAKITGMHDEFSNQDSLVRVSTIDQGTLDLTLKLGSRSLIYSSGTLLTTDVSGPENYSYLLRSGIRLDKVFENCVWENNVESSYANILGVDSTQELLQASAKSGVSTKHWGYFIKGTYQQFVGLSRIYGTNIIIQPELSYRYAKSTLSVNGQYLISEQFGEDVGFALNWTFSPSSFFTWRLTAQRWLISETTFFNITNPNSTKQFYLNFQMLITLNHKK
jgi:hypothetical protein